MRARTSHDRSVFCNSPLSTKSACGARVGRRCSPWRRHPDIFDLRQSIGKTCRHVRRHGRDLTIVIGGGDRHHRNGGRPAPEQDVRPDHRRDDGQRDDRAETSNGERRRAAQAK